MKPMHSDQSSDSSGPTSRERLQRTLRHEATDRVPVDLGATAVTGMAVSTVTKLRQALLGEADYRVKVIEPYQMLGEIDPALREALGVDVVGVGAPTNMFGFRNEGWKPFTLFDGTEVLVPEGFNVTPSPSGGWYIYPGGDTSVAPSGHMPEGGFYFDSIGRQKPIEESKLDPADNLADFGPLCDEDIEYMVDRAEAAAQAGLGAVLSVPGSGFGDIALVPGMWRKDPKGIRDVEEWYISTAARRDYVVKVFEGQCEIALANLERLIKALGDKVQVAFTTGTDFGTQTGLFCSPKTYRELYKPFHKAINETIHKHSNWKVFIHSCGAVSELIPEFIEAGFDILNPVQCSATGMDAEVLSERFGREVVFWGGGVDTQKTLPFGTPEQVYDEVCWRIETLGAHHGLVFNSIHNVQAGVPLENLLALFRAVKASQS